ncbi:MAG TPA: glycosyltransferase family 39 protein [Puia sp.]
MTEPHSYSWESWLQKWFVRLLIPAILVNAGGLLIPILEPDGALYATIAKTIARTGDFINLRVEGKDWLDKPHFPFWMAALSFRLFGTNGFAYKFPALLFWGMGAWYTYRLALSIYGKPTAQLATLLYVSAAHLVISNNDVRAEPYLTGLVIGSVFHFYKASRVPAAYGVPAGKGAGWNLAPGWHLVAGSFLAACAVMTKGPFVLITISAGLILDWILGKEWAQFRNIRWWIALLLVALFITPELYCLYIQFDLHPEKVIFGHTGVSGIRFFFWDSQFGRFFNTGPIKGSGDPLFYFHTLLWAFLPWSLLLYAAVVQKGRKVSSRSIPGDAICLGAAVASFIVFSLSRFQLPHYLNILFPFFSILTAGYLYQLHRRKTQKIIVIIQQVITILLPLLLLFLSWLFHFRGWPFMVVLIGGLSILAFRIFRGSDLPAVTARSFWSALLAYTFVNFCLYPAILRYQAGTEAGNYLSSRQGSTPVNSGNNTAADPDSRALVTQPVVYMPEETPSNYSFEFYSRLPVQRVPIDSLPRTRQDQLLFIPSAFSDSLVKKGFRVEDIQHFPNFHISQLTGEFLNDRTRSSTLEDYSLVRIHTGE